MRISALALAVMLGAVAAYAQTAPAPPSPTAAYDRAISNTWKNLHTKVLDMAKDFPEDKLGWKPHPDSRTMAQEFRHVTIGLEMTTAVMKGEKFDFTATEKSADAKPNRRASIVADMEAALAASLAWIDANGPKPNLIGWIDHQGEHYGKMVDGYRVNGLVPPVSRPKK
jgi:hypothetical protein